MRSRGSRSARWPDLPVGSRLLVGSPPDRAGTTAECFTDATAAEERWVQRARSLPTQRRTPWYAAVDPRTAAGRTRGCSGLAAGSPSICLAMSPRVETLCSSRRSTTGTSKCTPTVRRHWMRARVAAGRPDLRVHDLRHAGAVLAAQSGATLAELMARIGHSTPQAALRYQHAARGRDAIIAARMSEEAEKWAQRG